MDMCEGSALHLKFFTRGGGEGDGGFCVGRCKCSLSHEIASMDWKLKPSLL